MNRNSKFRNHKNLPAEFSIIGKSLLKISETKYKPLKEQIKLKSISNNPPITKNKEKVDNQSMIFSEYSFLNNAQAMNFDDFKTMDEISSIIKSVIFLEKNQLIQKEKNAIKSIEELFQIDWIELRESLEYEDFVNSVPKLFGYNEMLDLMYFASLEDIINFEEFANDALHYFSKRDLEIPKSNVYYQAISNFLQRNVRYTPTLSSEKSSMIWNIYKFYIQFEPLNEEFRKFFEITNKIMKDRRKRNNINDLLPKNIEFKSSTHIMILLTYLSYPLDFENMSREDAILKTLDFLEKTGSLIERTLICKLIKRILNSEKLEECKLLEKNKINSTLSQYRSLSNIL